ncbi:alpha/beta hydrolase family protein [Rhodoferax sp.]|uniref:alpha/beta hydrolase family protein n=1 Tax=Rhodoferax sp. TaxID=50421 RepID=UPI002775E778|nr:hypothetical protein [Rhodoferax sp.]
MYLPRSLSSAPVLLFSHGLGGSREGSGFLGVHWAARGYVAVFLQHQGSDDAVWRESTPGARMAALRRAANLSNTLLRLQDVPVVIDQLSQWHASNGHALAGRLDLSRIGMSGHSFGAVTTQAVSGQRDARGVAAFMDARIMAAVIMSPSSPRQADPTLAFGAVAIPWLLMTGTRDVAVVGDADVASRLTVFPALPPGAKYELVLHDAEHSAFSDRALPGDQLARNPNHHRAILALSTAFWDAHLRHDPTAKAWLDGHGPDMVLQGRDRWQKK